MSMIGRWMPDAATDTVPCKTCGTPTRMRGTKLCDGCWEVEHRLRDYLRDGGENARRFVEETLSSFRDNGSEGDRG